MTAADAKTADGKATSQSAFVRGFIDDVARTGIARVAEVSQSAFVRGFIDDGDVMKIDRSKFAVSIRVRARLHR